jgi:hypothetical protein
MEKNGWFLALKLANFPAKSYQKLNWLLEIYKIVNFRTHMIN